MQNMKLNDYLQKHNISGPDFGKIIKVSGETVRRWVKLGHRPTARIAKRIQTKTKGEITMEDLGW